MSRIIIFLLSSVIISLLFVQLSAGLDVERICERRCLYGRGGILCRCNAMHFTGKRSGGIHDTSPASRYLGDHSWKFGGVDSIARSRPSRKAFDLPKSLDGSRRPLAPLSTRAWDLERVKQIFEGLKTLAHQRKFFDLPRQTSGGKFPRKDLFAKQIVYPATTWASFPDNQGESQEGDSDLMQQPEPGHDFAPQTFGYSNSLRDSNTLETGNVQSLASQDLGVEHRETSGSRGQVLNDDVKDTPSDQRSDIAQLKDVLRQALRGR